MAVYHLRRADGSELGPLAASDLQALARAGRISPADLIRKIGTDGWHPAQKVRGLFPSGGEGVASGGARTAAPQGLGEWYFEQGGQRCGPVPRWVLRQMADDGTLTGGTLVWRDGMPRPVSLESVVTTASERSEDLLPRVLEPTHPSATKYEYLLQGVTCGPVALKVLQSASRRGMIASDTPVRAVGTTGWMAAEAVVAFSLKSSRDRRVPRVGRGIVSLLGVFLVAITVGIVLTPSVWNAPNTARVSSHVPTATTEANGSNLEAMLADVSASYLRVQESLESSTSESSVVALGSSIENLKQALGRARANISAEPNAESLGQSARIEQYADRLRDAMAELKAREQLVASERSLAGFREWARQTAGAIADTYPRRCEGAMHTRSDMLLPSDLSPDRGRVEVSFRIAEYSVPGSDGISPISTQHVLFKIIVDAKRAPSGAWLAEAVTSEGGYSEALGLLKSHMDALMSVTERKKLAGNLTWDSGPLHDAIRANLDAQGKVNLRSRAALDAFVQWLETDYLVLSLPRSGGTQRPRASGDTPEAAPNAGGNHRHLTDAALDKCDTILATLKEHNDRTVSENSLKECRGLVAQYEQGLSQAQKAYQQLLSARQVTALPRGPRMPPQVQIPDDLRELSGRLVRHQERCANAVAVLRHLERQLSEPKARESYSKALRNGDLWREDRAKLEYSTGHTTARNGSAEAYASGLLTMPLPFTAADDLLVLVEVNETWDRKRVAVARRLSRDELVATPYLHGISLPRSEVSLTVRDRKLPQQQIDAGEQNAKREFLRSLPTKLDVYVWTEELGMVEAMFEPRDEAGVPFVWQRTTRFADRESLARAIQESARTGPTSDGRSTAGDCRRCGGSGKLRIDELTPAERERLIGPALTQPGTGVQRITPSCPDCRGTGRRR